MKDFIRNFLNAVLPIACIFVGFALVLDSLHVSNDREIVLLSTGCLLMLTGAWMKGNDNNNTGASLQN